MVGGSVYGVTNACMIGKEGLNSEIRKGPGDY